MDNTKLNDLERKMDAIDKKREESYISLLTQMLQSTNESQSDIEELRAQLLTQYKHCPLKIEIDNIKEQISKQNNDIQNIRDILNRIYLLLLGALIGIISNFIVRFVK